MDCLSCAPPGKGQYAHTHTAFRRSKGWWKGTYGDDRAFHLLRLPRLRSIPLRLDPLELAFVGFYASFASRNRVPLAPLMPLEHLSHTHKRITHPFQIFQESFIPRPTFIHQQLLIYPDVARDGGDAVVQARHVGGVKGVSVGGGLGYGSEVQSEPAVLCRETIFTFAEAFGQGAEVYVQLRRTSDSAADCLESFGEVLWERVLEVGGEGFAGEFFLDGDGSLFAPDGQLLYRR